jgi:hypothetical protein
MASSRDRAQPAQLPRPETLAALDAAIHAHRAALSNEVLMRASIFAALVSATVIGISFLAQATQFSDATALLALVLLPVTLFVGLMTFLRAVEINREDAAATAALRQVNEAYALLDPAARDLIEAFAASAEAGPRGGPLGHGSRQRPGNLLRSLTTTSGVIAALNSVLAGAVVSIVVARIGMGMEAGVLLGAIVAVAAAVGQVAVAARRREAPIPVSAGREPAPSRGRARPESESRSRRTSRSRV